MYVTSVSSVSVVVWVINVPYVEWNEAHVPDCVDSSLYSYFLNFSDASCWGHGFFGFATLSFFDALPTTGNYTIYTMSGRREGFDLCDDLHAMRDDYIRSRNPHVTIRHLEQSPKLWIDFSRLVFAPNLLIPSAGSSWSLWSKLSNTGRVVTVPYVRDEDPSLTYPDNIEVWHNATVLYKPEKHSKSAQLLGFDNVSFVGTDEGKKMLFDCYRNC